ncbi:hypothetical protein [Chitinophaga defluvii]|uniref:Uncharacterized protein n=1 Tax=Chitinophaga defluvii TaxID=3163343 RepID=A0ABV2T1N8_9BACT
MKTRIEILSLEKPLCFADYSSMGEGIAVYQQILKNGHFNISRGRFSFRLLKLNKNRDQQSIFYIDKIKPLFLDLMSKWPFKALEKEGVCI